jgi:hypothetical protein
MTIFEEIKYSLVGQKPVTYKYFADGRRVLVEEDERVRWFVRLIVRLIVLLLFLSLLRLFGFIPSDWQTVSNVTGLSQNGTSNGNSGANGSNGNTSGAGSAGNTNGSSGGDGGLVFGSGNTSTDGQPGTAIGNGGTSTSGNGGSGANGAQGPAGPAGPAGKDGARGPAGPAGKDGISGIANGQGTASIGACDQEVKVILKSYWSFDSPSGFKLDQILIKNVSTYCSNQTLTLLLLNHPSNSPLSTITFNTGQIASPEGTLTINRNQIGTVLSKEITDVAFEISG